MSADISSSDAWFVPDTERTRRSYRSPYPALSWDENAWTRSRPHRHAAFTPPGRFYPRSLAAVLAHPRLAALPAIAVTAIEAHHLLRYLAFTIWLETEIVNPALLLLRRRGFISWLPDALRHDALRIYVDEGGHSEMSFDLQRRVEDATGVTSPAVPFATATTFAGLIAAEPEAVRPLYHLFGTVVTETLITGNLTTLTRDPAVHASVRETLADHAADEARHHAFFAEVYRMLQPNLRPELKPGLGTFLAHAIQAYLAPDAPWLCAVLRDVGVAAGESIVRELVEAPATRLGIADAAKATVSLAKGVGALEDPTTRAAFEAAGLASSPR